jgi:hypothetical protein
MRNAIKKVREAVSSKSPLAYLMHYYVDGSKVYASDGRVTAAAPCPIEGTFVVPAAELDAVMSKIEGELTFDLQPDKLVVKSGRFRSTIKTLDPAGFSHLLPTVAPKPLSSSVFDNLARLRAFISDSATHPWALCAYLHGGYAYGTNNVVVARVKCDGEIEGLLPCWAIDFILHRETRPTQVGWDDSHMAFWWEDGSWMRSQLVAGQFPPQAVSLLDDGFDGMVPISKDWKAAYEKVAALSEFEIRMDATAIRGGRGAADALVEEATPQLGDLSIAFNPAFLTPVLAEATMWDLSKHPRVPFEGDNIRGIIMGRT